MIVRSKVPAALSFGLALLGAGASCGGGIETDFFRGADRDDPPGTPSDLDGGASPSKDGGLDAPVRDGSATGDGGTTAPRPPNDGICTPGSMAAGTYDPDCVYLLGTTREGSCSYDAFIFPKNPTDRVYNFGCSPWLAFVRPTDGRLIFTSSANDGLAAYAYRPATTRSQWDWQQLQAHEKIETCRHLHRIFMFPDDGKLLYFCSFNDAGIGPWVEGSSEPFAMAGYYPMAAGEGRTVLGADTEPELHYAIIANGRATPLKDMEGASISTVRSRRGGGFFIVSSRLWVRAELREVLPTGETKILGTYQTDRPTGPAGPQCVIEPNGALDCIASRDFHDEIVRYTFNALPEVLYEERTNDVKMHISLLVTGP
ncbi:hypothetical protein [Pendulispora albinea]|uniref:Uncharacterized protein n=1 Tax=Pendulispora albinea TaxID=2741071 RepID=A0ABZ2LXR5_9BACT